MYNEETMVEMRAVSKRFGRVQALDKVDLTIERGKIIGLLGANGCGKSTLIRHIIGLYLPDAGQVVMFGCEAAKLGPAELGRIGYVHQEGELLDWMTVRQLIRYVSTYYENWNKELEVEYIKDFDIELAGRVGALSPGQRQKLAILLAIGFEPEFLILDEPAAGLDPIARGRFLDLLLKLIQTEGRTIIISSHILSDVEKVIDHALIMKEGRIVRDCSFDDLREEFCKVKCESLDGDLPEEMLLSGTREFTRSGKSAVMVVQNLARAELEAKAKQWNCEAEIQPLTLEEIYKLVVTE